MAILKSMTREEYIQKYNVEPFSDTTLPKEMTAPQGNFLTGLAKSGLSTLKGTLQLGTKAANVLLPKSLEPGDFMSEKDIQEKGFGFEKKYLTEEALKTRGTGEKLGKFTGDVAQFAIPGTAVSKATKALSFIPRIGARAGVSGLIGATQTGDIKGGAVAAGVEAGIPVVGKAIKPATALISRLLKGTGSGLSGASSQQIEAILKNPQAAQQAVKQLKQTGGASMLRKNAQSIVQGVSTIRQEARKAFGEGLEQLSEADIDPKTFKSGVSAVLNKYGSVIEKGKRVLQNVEFDDPRNIQKASGLIDRLSKVELSGKTLRKLADDIDASKFRTATSDERLAFNVFLKDLSKGLKDTISKSTTKLDEINKAFSEQMGLAEEIQKIFGKVKFKNASEILAVSKKLDNLFTQRGLAPESIDRFLQRIGIEPTGFRAGEAARQMGEIAPVANTLGISIYELIRSFTSAIVPPKTVRDIAIATGIGREIIQEWATKLSPTARSVLIRLFLDESQNPADLIESPDNTVINPKTNTQNQGNTDKNE